MFGVLSVQNSELISLTTHAVPDDTPNWFRNLHDRCGSLCCSAALFQWCADTIKGSRDNRDLSALTSVLEPPCSSRTLVHRLLRMHDTATVHWLLGMYRKSVGLLAAGGDDSTEDASQPLFFVDTRGKRAATDPKRMRTDSKDGSMDASGGDAASEGEQKEQEWHARAATVISGLGDEVDMGED